nr:DciA family protein [Roseomonas acroporae]
MRRRGAAAPLLADWHTLVGPQLAAVTAPRSLTGGTLTIACSGPMAMELTHLAPQLMERINAGLGQVAVQRLRFVQRPVQPGQGPAARPAPRGPAPVPDSVSAALGTVPGEGLRAALAKLAQGVYRNRR